MCTILSYIVYILYSAFTTQSRVSFRHHVFDPFTFSYLPPPTRLALCNPCPGVCVYEGFFVLLVYLFRSVLLLSFFHLTFCLA